MTLDETTRTELIREVALAIIKKQRLAFASDFHAFCKGQRHVAHELERVVLTSIRRAHTRRVQQSLRRARRREGSCATCLCPLEGVS